MVWCEDCMVYDRFRGERISATAILYPAELGCIYLLNNLTWKVIVFWKDYEYQRNQIQLVPYCDVTFNDELGKEQGKGTSQTD